MHMKSQSRAARKKSFVSHGFIMIVISLAFSSITYRIRNKFMCTALQYWVKNKYAWHSLPDRSQINIIN